MNWEEAPDFAASATQFGQGEWEELNDAVFLGTEAPRPCPACERTGFFGSRADSNIPQRFYRMCKFCGFFQNVGEESSYLVPNAHPCERSPTILGERYIQWCGATEVSRQCFSCAEEYDVRSHLVSRPSATPEHVWWQVPQDMDRAGYVAFWKGQGISGAYL